MSVRKRTWTTSKGERREAWAVFWTDAQGRRCQETYDRKKDAVEREAQIKTELKSRMHIAPSKSPTVKVAAESWLCASEAAGLERSTQRQYRQHVELHIVPLIGDLKLAEVTPAAVRSFEDELRKGERSPAMIRKVMTSLGTILADAMEQGLVARNAVRELRRNRKKGAQRRDRTKLKVGVDIPTTDEVARIIGHAEGHWRPLFVTAVFTGLRASELRGLRWSDVDLGKGELYVHQRADMFNDIGKPKSEAGERLVPFGKVVSNTLKEWKLACPPSDLDLVFPTSKGTIQSLSNIIQRGLMPTQIDAGVVSAEGKAKYTGMHALRHFYASWLINRPEEGGQGLPPKVAQERLGHSTITLTYDRYGHLFPRGDDASEIDAAELRLLNGNAA